MKVTLAKEKSDVEILAIDIKNGRVDFKWLDGRYNGVCSADTVITLSTDQMNSISEQVEASIINNKIGEELLYEKEKGEIRNG